MKMSILYSCIEVTEHKLSRLLGCGGSQKGLTDESCLLTTLSAAEAKVLHGRRSGWHITVSNKLCDSSPGGLGYSHLLCVSLDWWLWQRLLSIHQISIPDILVMIAGLEYIIFLSSSLIGIAIGFGQWDININMCGDLEKPLQKLMAQLSPFFLSTTSDVDQLDGLWQPSRTKR